MRSAAKARPQRAHGTRPSSNGGAMMLGGGGGGAVAGAFCLLPPPRALLLPRGDEPRLDGRAVAAFVFFFFGGVWGMPIISRATLQTMRWALISARGTLMPQAGHASSWRPKFSPHWATWISKLCLKKSLPHVGHGVDGGGIRSGTPTPPARRRQPAPKNDCRRSQPKSKLGTTSRSRKFGQARQGKASFANAQEPAPPHVHQENVAVQRQSAASSMQPCAWPCGSKRGGQAPSPGPVGSAMSRHPSKPRPSMATKPNLLLIARGPDFRGAHKLLSAS